MSPGRRLLRRLATACAAATGLALSVPACAEVPSVENVQAAYDAARFQNAEQHVLDLVIQDAKCMPMRVGGYACQIDFVRRTAPEKRLFFDVITLDEKQGQWVLLSGLCVRASR